MGDEARRLSNGLTRRETIRLHNEPANAALGSCECPECRPDLHGPDEGGEA